MPKILAFAGSARSESFNKRLLVYAAKQTQAAGADVTVLDFADLPLPLYDGDLEANDGVPANALELKRLMKAHDGFLIACPEYNSSITPLLKNAIDWASRPVAGEAPLETYRGKTAALIAASPGGLGGLRGLVTVRSILGNIGVFVTPTQLAVPLAHQAFAEDGSLIEERMRKGLDGVVTELVRFTSRVAG